MGMIAAMTNPLPPQPGFGMGTDVAGIERALDDAMPDWRSRFGDDLPDGMDLRPAVVRTRAWIRSLIDDTRAGRLTVTGLTPEETLIRGLEMIRAQLSGPTMLGDPVGHGAAAVVQGMDLGALDQASGVGAPSGGLVEFVLARVEEDEQVAKGISLPYTVQGPDVEHYSRWIPLRVVMECQIKRKVIEAVMAGHPPEEHDSVVILRLMGLPYQDHADYRSEWSPF